MPYGHCQINFTITRSEEKTKLLFQTNEKLLLKRGMELEDLSSSGFKLVLYTVVCFIRLIFVSRIQLMLLL